MYVVDWRTAFGDCVVLPEVLPVSDTEPTPEQRQSKKRRNPDLCP